MQTLGGRSQQRGRVGTLNIPPAGALPSGKKPPPGAIRLMPVGGSANPPVYNRFVKPAPRPKPASAPAPAPAPAPAAQPKPAPGQAPALPKMPGEGTPLPRRPAAQAPPPEPKKITGVRVKGFKPLPSAKPLPTVAKPEEKKPSLVVVTEEKEMGREEALDRMEAILVKTRSGQRADQKDIDIAMGIVAADLGAEAVNEIMGDVSRTGKDQQVAVAEAIEAIDVAEEMSAAMSGDDFDKVVRRQPVMGMMEDKSALPYKLNPEIRFDFSKFDEEVDGLDDDGYEFEPF